MTSQTRTGILTTIAVAALLVAAALAGCNENTKLLGTGEALDHADAATPGPGPMPGPGPTTPAPVPAQDAAAPKTDATPSCPPRVCTAIFCPYGNKHDANGCSTCECNPAPAPDGCAAVQCPTGQRCELRDVQCFAPPCKPVPTCVPDDPNINPCAARLCPSGTMCVAKQVTCVRAPCPPVAECVPIVRCGGIAAIRCPGNGACQDDPSDSCDPAHGGADCGGLCVCKPPAGECPPDRIWNSSPAVCACALVPAPVRCGRNTCADGEYCCNESCGTCAPQGGGCDAKLCAP
jgi:hypothetical protein